MALSPDGEASVTSTVNETLRFWNMISKAHSQKASTHFIHWENIHVFLMDHNF
jgi:WD40 repeat protein